MGMILGLTTLGDGNIARVLADPPLLWRVIAPDDPEAYESARKAFPRGSFLARILGRGRTAAGADAPFTLALGEGQSTDLDKAWQGIHYLLTGSALEGVPPLNFLVLGGCAVGKIDVGYGPARALMSSETRTAQEALARLTDDELRGRFNPEDMMKKEIYPGIWDRDPREDDTLGYLMEYVRALRAFLAKAVAQRQGVLLTLT